MESILRCLGYTRNNSTVDAGVLDDNIIHARQKAKAMVVRKLRTKRLRGMLLKNDQAGRLFADALRLDPENDNEFHAFVTILKQAVDSLGLKITL